MPRLQQSSNLPDSDAAGIGCPVRSPGHAAGSPLAEAEDSGRGAFFFTRPRARPSETVTRVASVPPEAYQPNGKRRATANRTKPGSASLQPGPWKQGEGKQPARRWKWHPAGAESRFRRCAQAGDRFGCATAVCRTDRAKPPRCKAIHAA